MGLGLGRCSMATTVGEELGVPRPLHLLLLIRSIVGGVLAAGNDTTSPSDQLLSCLQLLITVNSLHVAVVGVYRLVLCRHHLDIARDQIAGLARLVVLLLLLRHDLAVDRPGVIWQMLMRLLVSEDIES